MAPKTLAIIHTNDIQDAEANKFSRLVELIRSLAHPKPTRPIILDVGDGFQFLNLMEFIKYDAIALGNEDLTDNGIQIIKQMGSSIPFVSANFGLRVKGRSITRRPRWCRPYRIVRRSHLKVAVLGLVMQDDSFQLSKQYADDVVVSNPIEAAARWIPEAKAKADLLVVLFHGRLPMRDQLVRDFPEIDVMLSGHEHLVAGYGEIAQTIVGQAHSNIRSVGQLELLLKETSIDSWSSRVHPVEDHHSSAPDIDRLLDLEAKHKQTEPIIATTLTDFRPDRYWLDINGNNVNLRPNTPLGNWLVDSMKSFTGADVAIQKAWGIQHNLGPGPIRRSDIEDMILYDEELWVLHLQGKDLKAVFEYAFEKSYNNLAFSGAILTVDYRNQPGQRVVKSAIDGKEIDEGHLYQVVTSDFLAGGNTGFHWIRNASEASPLGIRLRDFVIDRLQELGTLKGIKTGRLTEVGIQGT